MTIPSALLGLLIASLFGSFYHLWRGGGPGRILFYLVLAWLGFFCGHFLASWLGWRLFLLGPMDLGMGIVGALAFLFLGDWLGMVERTSEN